MELGVRNSEVNGRRAERTFGIVYNSSSLFPAPSFMISRAWRLYISRGFVASRRGYSTTIQHDPSRIRNIALAAHIGMPYREEFRLNLTFTLQTRERRLSQSPSC